MIVLFKGRKKKKKISLLDCDISLSEDSQKTAYSALCLQSGAKMFLCSFLLYRVNFTHHGTFICKKKLKCKLC